MKIYEFVWTEERIEHIARHGVEPEELEEACFGRPLVRRAKATGKNPLYQVFGRTDAGRLLWTAPDAAQGAIQVRIGITTGEALVRLGARPQAGEGMVSGDVVNSASRLQTAAAGNAILVDEPTRRATGEMIDYADHEPASAKGKTEPFPVWEVLEARSRFGVDLLPFSSRSRIVGRERSPTTRATSRSSSEFKDARTGIGKPT